MSDTLQIINLVILIIIIGFAINSLTKSDRERKKKKAEEYSEQKRWERGAQIAANDKEYMAFVNDITGLGKEYDPHQWYYKMPDSALKHLEAFEVDERKVYLMKRAIELSIEHFANEMADDAECARIIEERVIKNPQSSKPLDIEELNRRRKSVQGDETKKDQSSS